MSGITHAFYLAAGLLSTLLAMAKFNGGFFGKWEAVFVPLITTLAIGSMVSIWSLYFNRNKPVVIGPGVPKYLIIHMEKKMSYNFAIGALEPLMAIAILIQLAELFNRLEKRAEKHPDMDSCGITIIVCCSISLIYRLRREAH